VQDGPATREGIGDVWQAISTKHLNQSVTPCAPPARPQPCAIINRMRGCTALCTLASPGHITANDVEQYGLSDVISIVACCDFVGLLQHTPTIQGLAPGEQDTMTTMIDAGQMHTCVKSGGGCGRTAPSCSHTCTHMAATRWCCCCSVYTVTASPVLSGMLCAPNTWLTPACSTASPRVTAWTQLYVPDLNTPQKVQLFLVPICDTIWSMLQPYSSRYDSTCRVGSSQ